MPYKDKEKRRKYHKQYYITNKEEITEYKKQYYILHKERLKKHNKQYYIVNKEGLNKHNKRYYDTHREEIIEQKKQYNVSHKEEGKQYRIFHKEERKQYNKQYLQTPAGKKADKKSQAKRRQLGFNSLNDHFEGSVAHHINYKDVIYIPKWLHRSIYHCLETRQGMFDINMLAMRFLINQKEAIYEK